MIQLLPDKIEIRFKFRRISGSHRSTVLQIKTNWHNLTNNGRRIIRTWTHQIIQYDQCDPDRLTNPAGIDPDTCGNGIKWCMVGAYNLFYREGNRVYTAIPAYQQAVA